MKSHPTIMFMTKTAFFKMGGLDEDLCGHYGFGGSVWQWKAKNTVGVKQIAVDRYFNVPYQ